MAAGAMGVLDSRDGAAWRRRAALTGAGADVVLHKIDVIQAGDATFVFGDPVGVSGVGRLAPPVGWRRPASVAP